MSHSPPAARAGWTHPNVALRHATSQRTPPGAAYGRPERAARDASGGVSDSAALFRRVRGWGEVSVASTKSGTIRGRRVENASWAAGVTNDNNVYVPSAASCRGT